MKRQWLALSAKTMFTLSVVAVPSLSILLAGCGQQPEVAQAPAPSSGSAFGKRIVNADKEPQNWLSTGRDYGENRFSPLDQINVGNINGLKLAWSYDLDTNRGQESTPIAVDGKLFTTSAWSKVQAFDVVSGKLLWQFDPQVPGESGVKACCDVVNRGAAYWDGKVYVGTIDGRLIAIDANSGRQLWSVQTTDPDTNNTITGAPRIVKGRVIIGNGGAELGARGYVTAYDAETGSKAWRFYIVPGNPSKPDGEISDRPLKELAQKTWTGDAWWKRDQGGGGGGTAWDSMAYDPELDLLYIGTGNSSFWDKSRRSPGDSDNLFVASVLALRPETGEYVWHYQETPGDEWDYTSTQQMILTTIAYHGQPRKVLLHAPKNGYFYVIDRASGKYLDAKPFVPINWSTGLDANGRPQVVDAARYDKTGKQWIGLPSGVGAHSWMPMSYSSQTKLVYIPVQEVPGAYEHDPKFVRRPVGSNLTVKLDPFDAPTDPKEMEAARKIPKGYLLAWDPVKQKEAWRASNPGLINGGVLSTAGNLVFQGDLDGRFNAYNAQTGAKIWSFDGQTGILAAPISFAADGKQYVSVVVGFGGVLGVSAGQLLWSKDGPRLNKSRVLTFVLDGKGAALAPPTRPKYGPLTPPAQFATAATIEQGRHFYLNTCMPCHGSGGVSTGVMPDLRRSGAIESKEAFHAVVGEGLLAANGMANFSKNYNASEIEAIRAYVIDRAHKNQVQ